MLISSNRRPMLAALLLGAALVSTSPAVAKGASSLTVSGSQEVKESTRLKALTIEAGGALVAPEGKTVSLSVDGVGRPLVPGRYTGDVALTVSSDIPVRYKELPVHHFRAGVYIDNGRYVAEKSVAAVVKADAVSDRSLRNVRISSTDTAFNGILVGGNSKYVIDGAAIDLTGDGGNDFAGFGAAVMSTGSADVTVNDARISTHGVVRPAFFVGQQSVMHINNSMIDVRNGVLPADYKFTVELGQMKEVPWMLGLRGTARGSNIVDKGTLYFNNSHIRTEGWGALSTDDAMRVRMYVKDSLIETTKSGYGAYSIGDSIDEFSNTHFDVADMALIMAAQGSAIFTDGSTVTSRRFGVMIHSGGEGGTLTIEKKSVFNTRDTGIQFKSRGGNVIIDDAKVIAANGILLQAMVTDDAFIRALTSKQAIVGVQTESSDAASEIARKSGMVPNPAVRALFKNTTLYGDVINSRTAEGNLFLTLENAKLTGAASTAIQSPRLGREPTQETLDEIGELTNRFAPSEGAYGLEVSVDATSVWRVTKTSYLSGLTIAQGGQVIASQASHVSMTVDGKPQPIRAGKYSGRIVLTVE